MLYSLSLFRIIFIFLIFMEHYPSSPLRVGGEAVCFFFVLSGFVLSYGYGHKISNREITYKDFLLGRMIKVYPLHWLTLPIGFWITRNAFLQTAPYLPANVLLLQSLIPNRLSYFSGNGVSWFLSTTVLLYMLFPFLWKICSRSTIQWNIVLYGILIIFRCLLETVMPENIKTDWLYINPLVRWMDFTIGIITYLLYKRIVDTNITVKNKWGVMAFTAVSIATPIAVFYFAHDKVCPLATFWVAYSVLIGGGALVETWRGDKVKADYPNLMKGIKQLGNITFSFYLWHQIIILVLWNHPPVNMINNSLTKFLLILFLCTSVAILFQKYFERPIEKRLKNIIFQRRHK